MNPMTSHLLAEKGLYLDHCPSLRSYCYHYVQTLLIKRIDYYNKISCNSLFSISIIRNGKISRLCNILSHATFYHFLAYTSGRCNRQSEFTLLHFTIFH